MGAALIRTILLGGLLLLAANAADAAEMPSMFHGRWCGEPHMMKHCGNDQQGIQITARGFHYELGESGCRLVGLTPQRPTRGDVEYRATFVCGGGRAPDHREYYWIGFYDDDRNEGLFLLKTDKTFGSRRRLISVLLLIASDGAMAPQRQFPSQQVTAARSSNRATTTRVPVRALLDQSVPKGQHE